jgi:hypothetical protein
MRLQDFGSYERVHEDLKHVDTHGKTHRDTHDDTYDDAQGRFQHGVDALCNDAHMVVYKVDKHVDLDSFDYSFLILTTS